jgi:hypothetical protein
MKDAPETIGVSEFKAKCLGIFRRVQKTGRPVVVTRRGQRIRFGDRRWLGSGLSEQVEVVATYVVDHTY